MLSKGSLEACASKASVAPLDLTPFFDGFFLPQKPSINNLKKKSWGGEAKAKQKPRWLQEG